MEQYIVHFSLTQSRTPVIVRIVHPFRRNPLRRVGFDMNMGIRADTFLTFLQNIPDCARRSSVGRTERGSINAHDRWHMK